MSARELRDQTSDRLETVILDVTKTESISAATQWVKERVGDRGKAQIPVCISLFLLSVQGRPLFRETGKTLLGTLKVSKEGPSGQQLEAETSFQRLIMSRL